MNILLSIRILNLAFFLLCISQFAHGQAKNYIDQPYVETTAKIDTSVTPDLIYLSILISEDDTKGKQTVEDLEVKMGATLISIGVNLESQLTLSDLSSNFKNYFLRKKDIIKAKAYELLVYDAKSAGRVIYELEGIGISNVDLSRTEYSKIEKLKINLITRAVLKARAQANAMVIPLGQSIGKALHISDINSDIVNMLQGKVAGVRIRGSESIARRQVEFIAIEFEKIKLTSEVSVKFAIQ